MKDVDFVNCPQCGTNIKHREHHAKICSLCQQPLSSNDSEEYILIEKDLIVRRKEVGLSIEKMINQKSGLIKELYMLNDRRVEIDMKLSL